MVPQPRRRGDHARDARVDEDEVPQALLRSIEAEAALSGGRGGPPGPARRRDPLLRVLARTPFTLLFEITIVLVAFWNGSAQGSLSEELRRAWGFGPLYFWREHWHTLATNTFFVRNAIMLLGMVLFVAGSVGVYEWIAGTRRALLCFWAANVVTLLLTAGLVVFPMHLAGVPPRWDWAPSGDVGASFGGFGCLGACLAGVPGARRRIVLVLVVTAGLIAKFLLLPEIFGDAGHLVAFYVGVLMGARFPYEHRLAQPGNR